MTHSFWWLTVDALCVYRLTILAVRDTITEPFRAWLTKPFRKQVETGAGTGPRGWRYRLFGLITCPWCVSIWIAAVVVMLTRFAPHAWQYPAIGFAFSAVAGFLADR